MENIKKYFTSIIKFIIQILSLTFRLYVIILFFVNASGLLNFLLAETIYIYENVEITTTTGNNYCISKSKIGEYYFLDNGTIINSQNVVSIKKGGRISLNSTENFEPTLNLFKLI